MTRNTLKTLAGLLIIVLIVVGTFLIGNLRHQSQVRHDASVQRQQQAAADQKAKDDAAKQQATTSQPKPATSNPTPSPAPTPAPSASASTNSSTKIPDTGPSEDLMLVPVALIGGLSFMLYRSRRAVRVAVRSRR